MGVTAMTDLQDTVIYEMWRQGLHHPAATAEQCWSRGKEFELDPWISVPRTLRQLLEEANREASSETAH